MEGTSGLVFDTGSHTIKAGFAGDDAPRAVVDNVIGRYTNNSTNTNVTIGVHAKNTKALLNLTYPIERGLVQNWDDMERVWYFTFYNELSVDPIAHPVLLTEPPFNPKLNRERTTQIMFESFGVMGTYLANQALLPIYTCGSSHGVVVESGEGTTFVAPISDLKILPHAVQRLDIGGIDLTDYMMKMLSQRGKDYNTFNGRYLINKAKELHCYIAQNFEEEIKQLNGIQNEVPFELPYWEEKFYVGDLRVQCPEVMFQPSLIGIESPGIHELVHDAIAKCDESIQREMCLNIVLSGGNTLFAGFAERLEKEIMDVSRRKNTNFTNIKVVAPLERQHSTWIGGSILGSTVWMDSLWITKAEYQECGSAIVHKKCPEWYCRGVQDI